MQNRYVKRLQYHTRIPSRLLPFSLGLARLRPSSPLFDSSAILEPLPPLPSHLQSFNLESKPRLNATRQHRRSRSFSALTSSRLASVASSTVLVSPHTSQYNTPLPSPKLYSSLGLGNETPQGRRRSRDLESFEIEAKWADQPWRSQHTWAALCSPTIAPKTPTMGSPMATLTTPCALPTGTPGWRGKGVGGGFFAGAIGMEDEKTVNQLQDVGRARKKTETKVVGTSAPSEVNALYTSSPPMTQRSTVLAHQRDHPELFTSDIDRPASSASLTTSSEGNHYSGAATALLRRLKSEREAQLGLSPNLGLGLEVRVSHLREPEPTSVLNMSLKRSTSHRVTESIDTIASDDSILPPLLPSSSKGPYHSSSFASLGNSANQDNVDGTSLASSPVPWGRNVRIERRGTSPTTSKITITSTREQDAKAPILPPRRPSVGQTHTTIPALPTRRSLPPVPPSPRSPELGHSEDYFSIQRHATESPDRERLTTPITPTMPAVQLITSPVPSPSRRPSRKFSNDAPSPWIRQSREPRKQTDSLTDSISSKRTTRGGWL